MTMPGLPELLIVFAIVVLLFGAPKIPKLFGAFGEGIKNFKKGIKPEDEELKEGDEADKAIDKKSDN
ncbi:MAG: twin-arginine translocase TatA/TatE family subunit [Oligoflexales bacterium]|nr:twin-arginine translocase TatA/TatE family subunit [Oligoflexales bacterium]